MEASKNVQKTISGSSLKSRFVKDAILFGVYKIPGRIQQVGPSIGVPT